MQVDSVIENIVNIATDWNKGGKSLNALMFGSGYCEHVDAITEDLLKKDNVVKIGW